MEPDELWASARQTSLRLRAYDGPEGAPAIVALHGLAAGVDGLTDARAGLDPFAELARLGCHVLALDWPGHGRSGGRRGHLTYRLAMEAAAAAVDVATVRWRAPVSLFGAGLGGVLAFYAALEDGRVASVACAGLLDLRDPRPALGRLRRAVVMPVGARASSLVGDRLARRLLVPLPALLSHSELASDPVLARRLVGHRQAVTRYSLAGLTSILCSPADKPDVRAQRAPVLAAVGGGDTVLPETTTRALTRQLTCPSQTWVLPGAGHQLLLEHPRALLPTVAEFVHGHTAHREAG